MAASTTARPLATTGGALKPIVSLFDAVVAWNDARKTRQALRQLNTHQLNDIGLLSSDIDLFVTKYR
ncbi:MAG: DUF1127 domain-containing protein [Pseudomonadota bacterium]